MAVILAYAHGDFTCGFCRRQGEILFESQLLY